MHFLACVRSHQYPQLWFWMPLNQVIVGETPVPVWDSKGQARTDINLSVDDLQEWCPLPPPRHLQERTKSQGPAPNWRPFFRKANASAIARGRPSFHRRSHGKGKRH